jgi:hypothetical protein
MSLNEDQPPLPGNGPLLELAPDQERQRADQERQRADEQAERAKRLEAQLRALGIQPSD